MTDERRAVVGAWLTHLLHVEADAIDYRWPPASEEERREAAALQAMATAAWRRACRLVGLRPGTREAEEGLWRRALDEWDGGDGP